VQREPSSNLSRPAALTLLNGIVVLWGLTAILGRLITIDAIPLVWYRVVLVTIVLAVLVPARGLSLRIPRARALRYAGIGVLIGIHWVLFYGSVKLAGIATGVLTLSTGAFFTAIVEPRVFGRRVRPGELVIGAIVVVGVALLLQVEVHASPLGLGLGLASSMFSSIFGVFNGKFAPHEEPEILVFYELGAASVAVSLCFIFVPGQFVAPWQLSLPDLGWLVVLAVVCTVVTQVLLVRVLRTVSPFTVAVATNLEPVYALIMAAVLFADEEPLRLRFYVGATLLLGLVIVTSARRARGAGAPRA
jgi:drug/metabolite transporter (DMT)-like permease